MKNERTFVMIKPDGVLRSFVGEIIARIERTGLKIVSMKMFVPTKEQCWEHYSKDDKWFAEKGSRIVEERKARGAKIEKEAIEYGKDIIERIVKYVTAGPVVAMVIEGNQAVGIVKKLVGGTEPLTSDVGTIRGDLTLDSYGLADVGDRGVRNLIHCSTEVSGAQREIEIWVRPEEIIKYKSIQEKMLYDVNLDGILE